MSVDSIGNFLTIIRNGVLTAKRSVSAPHSRMKHQIAKILKDEGFIRDFSIEEHENNSKTLTVHLKYINGESAIHEIIRISKPSRRVYEGVVKLRPVIGGLGVAILTTSKGIMTNKQARQEGVGGEVLCTVW